MSSFGTIFLRYLIATFILCFILFLIWVFLDKFPKLKKLRNAIEHILNTINNQY